MYEVYFRLTGKPIQSETFQTMKEAEAFRCGLLYCDDLETVDIKRI